MLGAAVLLTDVRGGAGCLAFPTDPLAPRTPEHVQQLQGRKAEFVFFNGFVRDVDYSRDFCVTVLGIDRD